MVRRVVVSPYDPSWPAQFRAEADALTHLWVNQIVAVHHIGSTAIPGAFAKPIVDVLVEVHDIEAIDTYDDEMIRRGYLPKGENGIPRRRFFLKGTEETRTHHIHVYQACDPQIARHLAFRDFMIAHPKEAEAYSHLKQTLAARFPEDIASYVEGKDGFVQEIERRALLWRDCRGRDDSSPQA
jgi:GrpB-like predicted nucleotidyltransferase (UPF0157 family)